jgi:hypothetical protein
MQFLDRLGWPVERVKGRPVLNLIRLLIHTRRIVRKWEQPAWVTKQSDGVSAAPTGGRDGT